MLRVLVVDDDAGSRDALAIVLSLEGYAVETAADAAEAIACARRLRPDIVVCDLDLGVGGDGFSVARAIRRDATTAVPRLVALSGADTREAKDRAATAGFEAYLLKPVAVTTLLAALGGAGEA